MSALAWACTFDVRVFDEVTAPDAGNGAGGSVGTDHDAATDGAGAVQTADEAPPYPAGATGYPKVSVTLKPEA